MEQLWERLLQSIIKEPRDFQTHPKTNKTPIWFHATSDGKAIYITSAQNHRPSSNISSPRRLGFEEFTTIYPLHLRREKGEPVSKEAQRTRNQVYWYGLIYNCLDQKEKGNNV